MKMRDKKKRHQAVRMAISAAFWKPLKVKTLTAFMNAQNPYPEIERVESEFEVMLSEAMANVQIHVATFLRVPLSKMNGKII